jgi:UPF0755 protein
MKKIIPALFLFLIVFAFALFLFFKANLTSVSSDIQSKTFTVNSGDKILTISQNLEKDKLIKNHFVFVAYAFITGQNKSLQSGNFRLSPSLTVPEIIKKLSSGGVADYWLKIIDGTRVEELSNSFPTDLSFTGADFVAKAKNLQGYIYPDSYLIPEYFTMDQVLATIQDNFDKKFAQARVGATNTQMTDKEILTLASIIEREARTLKVKEGVAGVLINRINSSTPLQSDVTIQYVRDTKTKPTNYWKDIDSSDISIVSPYNTYKNPGLPPGPICNPGYDSIYAAFHPTQSGYLFYLTGNDGVMHYAKTLEEHNTNIEKYLK